MYRSRRWTNGPAGPTQMLSWIRDAVHSPGAWRRNDACWSALLMTSTLILVMVKSLRAGDAPASAFKTRTVTHIHEASEWKQVTPLYHPSASGFVLLTTSKGSAVSSAENLSTLAFVCKRRVKARRHMTCLLMICLFSTHRVISDSWPSWWAIRMLSRTIAAIIPPAAARSPCPWRICTRILMNGRFLALGEV